MTMRPNIYIFSDTDTIDFWFPCTLEVYGYIFNSVGHLVLYEKLKYLKLVDAAKCLASQRSLSRNSLLKMAAKFVRDAEVDAGALALWSNYSPTIQLRSFLLRANTDLEFKQALLDTHNAVLAYDCADAMHGIGKHADKYLPHTWGKNQSGKILMQVRSMLPFLEMLNHPTSAPVLPDVALLPNFL